MDQPHEQLKQQAKREEGVVEKTAPQAPATVTKPVRRYRAYLFQFYLLAAVIGFGVLLFFARITPYFAFDLSITRALQTIQWSPFRLLMQFLTETGFAPISFVWSAALIVAIFLLGLRWEAVMTLFSVGGAMLLDALFKEFVQRARPSPDLVNVFGPLSAYSFPSGHVLMYVGLLGFVTFLIFTLVPASWWRNAAVLVLVLLIALIGPSRIYLGQHWPSDVLGAYLLGSLWLALSIYVYRWGKTRFFVHQPAAAEKPVATVVQK